MRDGYRITVLLRREGWHVNVKRVHRRYRLEGLQMRLKPPRRRVMAKLRDDRSNATGPNQVWAMDWMHDELFDGLRLWVLTVVDTWSRMWSVMRVCRSATAVQVIDALEQARPAVWLADDDPCRPGGASSPRRSSICELMRTASRWTSAAQASRPTMPTWKASTPRYGLTASAGTDSWIWTTPAKRLKNGVPSTSAHRNTHLSMPLKRTGSADRDAIPRGALGSGVRVR
jgi:hypothetical protein